MTTHTSRRPLALLAASFTLALVAPASPARAALDALCGTTLTTSVTLDHDVDCTGYTGNALTIGADNVTIDGAGFRLLAPDSARAISIVNRSNVAIRNLTVSGWCTGNGIYIDGGSGHTLEDLDADGRSIGVDVRNTSDLTIRRLSAEACSDAGLSIRSTTGTITLEGLALTNNNIGLRLNAITGPRTLGPAQVTSLAGNDTSIIFEANVNGVTVEGLTLDGTTYGVNATSATNANLVLRDLDVSATTGTGSGIDISGVGHTVSRVIANRRGYGVRAATVTNLTLDDVRATGAVTIGVELTSVTAPLSLRKLTLEDSVIGLRINAFAPATRFSITPYDAGTGTGVIASLAKSDTGITLINTQNLRVAGPGLALDNLSYGIDASSATNANLRFEDLDLSSTRFVSGYGLYLAGANHVLERVTANTRNIGVYATGTSNLAVTDLTATGCSTGLHIYNLTAANVAPALTRLTLTDNTLGLYLQAIATPLGLSPTNAIDVRRSNTGITYNNSTNQSLTGLSFDNPTTGVDLANVGNTNFTITNVDFSGHGLGNGLILRGRNHVLTNVTADLRVYGFQITETDQLTVDGLTARRCATGLYMVYFYNTYVAPALSDLVLTDNTLGLYLHTWTLPTQFTFSPAMGLDLSGNATNIQINNSTNLAFVGLTLDGVSKGVFATTGNTNLTFDSVDVSGPGYGTGLDLAGANHRLLNLTASRRGTGVSVATAQGLQVTDLTARNNVGYGLVVSGVTAAQTAPTFAGLDLGDSETGLYLSDVKSPLTLDQNTGLTVEGCGTGIYLVSNANLTLRNLTITDTTAYGVHAYYDNTNLTFEGVDVSGYGAGVGIKIGYLHNNSAVYYGGSGHTLRNVTANRRTTGVHLVAANAATIEHLTARFNSSYGLVMQGQVSGFVAPSLKNIDLSDNEGGLSLDNFRGTTATPVVIGAYDAGTGLGAISSLQRVTTGVVLTNCSDLVFQDLSITDVPWHTGATGINVNYCSNLTFRDLVLNSGGYGVLGYYGNSGFTFEDLDVSGLGAGVGIQLGQYIHVGPTYYGGANHVIRRVVANRRATGLVAMAASNLTVEDFTGQHNVTGLRIEGVPTGFTPPTLSGLRVDDSSIGLFLNNFGGTSTTPFAIGPTALTSSARCSLNLQLTNMSYTRVHDLTLDGRTYGVDASTTTNVTFADLVVSGVGIGTGLRVTGANPVIERVTADRRDYGVNLSTTSNPTLRDVTATRSGTAGVYLGTTTLPITLERLSIADNKLGLSLATVTGTGSLTLGSAAITTHARSVIAITLSSAPAVTVDTAALGLTAAGGNYTAPAPASNPICGTTLTADLTLTGDLDCGGTSGAALTIGANNLTIDGQGFRILAPRATVAIDSVNRSGLTVKNVDVSGAWASSGAGVSINGGSGHLVRDVLANARDRGVHITNATNVSLDGVTAIGTTASGVYLDGVVMPLAMSRLALTRGSAGLRMRNVDGAGLVIDGAALTNLTGNDASIVFENTVRNLTVDGPITGLDGFSNGISAASASNANLTFSDLDLSARRLGGQGMSLQGDGHTVTRVTAAYRNYGLHITAANALTLDDVTLTNADTEGIRLGNVTTTLLRDLVVNRSQVGLAFNGTTGGGLTITPYDAGTGAGVIGDLAGCFQGISVTSSSNLVFDGLTLDSPSVGLNANSAGNSALTFRDLVLSHTRRVGHGLQLSGTGHLVEDVTADRRDVGVYATSAANLTLRRVTADRAVTAGVQLITTTSPLVIEGLTSRRSGVGLLLNGLAGTLATPFDLGPYNGTTGAIASLAGSVTGIQLTNVQDAVVHDLVLDGNSYGVYAPAATNARLRFEDLDASGRRGTGAGLYLQGTDLDVLDVTADYRNQGVVVTTSTDLDVRHLRARNASGQALYLITLTPPLTLVDLSLGKSNVGVYLNNVYGTSTTPIVFAPYNAATDTGAITDLGDCAYSFELTNTREVVFTGLTLDGRVQGIKGSAATNRAFEVRDVDLTPRRFGGEGMQLYGNDHEVLRVTARHRDYGASFGQVGNLSLTDFTATEGGIGLYLFSTPNDPVTYTAPTLSDLTLSYNTTGLWMNAWQLPLTLDGAAGLDLTGSRTGILLNTISNLTVRNLAGLDNPTYGIRAESGAFNNLRFEDLDVSGHGFGTGLNIAGTAVSPVVNRVTANDRDYGVTVNGSSGLTVTALTANDCSTGGLYLLNSDATTAPVTLSDLDLADNSSGLYLYNWKRALTLNAATGLDVNRSNYGVRATSYNANLTLEDLVLDNPLRGVALDDATNASFVMRRLNVSGTGRGRGLQVYGASHVIEDVVANDRDYGLYANTTAGLAVARLSAARASSSAFYLLNLTTGAAPTLSDLRLTASTYGFQANTVSRPMTLDATAFSDLSRNLTPIYLTSYVTDMTVRGLTLSSPATGLWAGSETNLRLTLDQLDTTGYCRGTGVSIAGTDTLLSEVTAARRAYGVQMSNGDRVTLRDSVVGANTTGVYVIGGSTIPNTTVVADATNTATRFRVAALGYIVVGQTLRVAMPGGPEDRVVSAVGSSFVTFTAALSGVPPVGATVRGTDFGSARFSIESSDICANGTGLSSSTHLVPAATNYWRASTGPRHSSVPAGTGDLVTATNTTLTPFEVVPTDKTNPYCNQAPIAEAGPDQTACEGDVVTLDASASYDPDVEPLLYGWLQLSGPTATLDDQTLAITTFVAPAPPVGSNAATLTFELTVDDLDIERTDTTAVAINRRNPAPTAVAGTDQAVDEGAPVSLSAAGSVDPEGTTLTYAWVQTGGTAVTLTGADTASPSFTAPLVSAGGAPTTETLTFALTVTDEALPDYCGGPSSATDTLSVTVANLNHPPTADAGADDSVGELATVTLEGTLSSDPDGDALTFTWVQTGGTAVTLTGADTASPTFTSPDLPCGGSDTLIFEVSVDDGYGGADTDTVSVLVSASDADGDGDGTPDCADGCPEDGAKTAPGICGCGIIDTDSDGDLTADCNETCDADPAKIEPGVCGCGVPDTDTDGDGALDCVDLCPLDAAKVAPGVCGCGIADADTDGDGALDCLEGCPSDPAKTAPGVCGCGVADTDGDGDGTLDCLDGCPTDPAKIEPGQCGCGRADVDRDGDGVADCEDLCAAYSAETCLGTPFYVTVRTAAGLGQIACRYDGATLSCANTAGVAIVTPVTEATTCQ